MAGAETLHCPNCGAAVSSDSSKCEFCGARLATVACPRCFGMMFVGEKFCSHCGAVAQRTETGSNPVLPCPKCKVAMKTVQVGKSSLAECPTCEGMWLDATTFQLICDEKEQQAAILGMPAETTGPATVELSFHYIPCPVCGQLMNRVNFARFSGVILDICKEHGTWFDRDELRRVVNFIRAGGLDKARARMNADEEAAHERRMNAADAGIPQGMQGSVNWDREYTGGSTLSSITDFLTALLK